MKRIVVKIGSSIIAPAGKLDTKLIDELAQDVITTEKMGCGVILVTSGAIACGAHRLSLLSRPRENHKLMALASIGQIVLMDAYSNAFKKYSRSCAQILLTWDDFDNRKRFLNARSTLEELLRMGIIPVINENDAVSSDEIKFGDNDRLSALVADLISADLVVILSDVKGLLDENKLVTCVPKINAKVLSLVKQKQGTFTSGGMLTKLQAANIANSTGASLIITSGKEKKVISRIASGEKMGTIFLAAEKVEQARKRWIKFSKKAKGKVFIDDGAKEAILHKGKSLLAVGIIKIEGEFKAKDAIEVYDTKNSLIGCGLTTYGSTDLCNCREKKYDKEVIHRDNFTKMDECL